MRSRRMLAWACAWGLGVTAYGTAGTVTSAPAPTTGPR